MIAHPLPYDLLIEYTAETLDASAALFVGAHLAHCPRCAATVRRFQAVRVVLNEGNLLAAPAATLVRAQNIYAPRAIVRKSGLLKRSRHAPVLDPVPALFAFVLALALWIASLQALAPAIESTLPGDVLYPAKMTFEGMQIAATLDQASKVQVELTFASTRVTEIQQLADQHRYTQIPAIAHAYEGTIQSATTMLDHLIQHDPASHQTLARQAVRDLSQNMTRLASLQQVTPVEFQPQIARAVDASQEAQASVQKQLDQGGTPSLPIVPSLQSAPVFTSTAAPGLIPTSSTGLVDFASPTPSHAPTAVPSVTTRDGEETSVPPASNSTAPSSTAIPPRAAPVPSSIQDPSTSPNAPTRKPHTPNGKK